MKLTEKVLTALELPEGINERLFTDDALTGLSLRLRRGASGVARSWVYRYSIAGRAQKISFDYSGHSLAAARKRAGDLQARIRLGADPAQERAQTRADVGQTLAVTLRAYLPQKRLTLRPRSYGEVERHLLKCFEPLHRLPLRLVSPRDVNARYLAIANESGRTTANNSWRSLSAFFVWCVKQGLVERNPCIGVERFKDRKRDRILSATEIKVVWDATAGPDDYSAIVRLLLLSGCRASEISGLRRDEIYSDRLVLPPTRTKNGRQHVIPLTATMREILERRELRPGKEHVFGRPDNGGFSGWGESKAALDARIAAAGVKMEPWVHHDLRRTFCTGCGELGIMPHVIELAVNHVSGFRHGVAGTYNLSLLEREVARAFRLWDLHVREIVEGRLAGDRVVPLSA